MQKHVASLGTTRTGKVELHQPDHFGPRSAAQSAQQTTTSPPDFVGPPTVCMNRTPCQWHSSGRPGDEEVRRPGLNKGPRVRRLPQAPPPYCIPSPAAGRPQQLFHSEDVLAGNLPDQGVFAGVAREDTEDGMEDTEFTEDTGMIGRPDCT